MNMHGTRSKEKVRKLRERSIKRGWGKPLTVLLAVFMATAVAVLLQGGTNEGNDATTRLAHPFEYSVSKDSIAYVVSLDSIYGETTSDYTMTTQYAIWKDGDIVYPASGPQDLSKIRNRMITDTKLVTYLDHDSDNRLSAGDEFKVSTTLASEDNYLLGLSSDPSIEWYWLKLRISGSEANDVPSVSEGPSMATKLDIHGLPTEAEPSPFVRTPKAWEGEDIIMVSAEELQSHEEETTDNPEPMSPGSLTVIGRFLFEDENGAWQPLRWATIYIYDVEWWGNDYLDAVLTGSDGRFSYGPIINDDGWLQDGYDIKVRVYLETSAARVKNSGTYDGWTPEYSNRPDGTLDVGDWGPPTGEEGAWCIFDALTDGWDYLQNHGPGYTMEKSTAKWPHESWPHYHHGGNIHLPDNDAAFSPDIVIHEYGHNVMYVIYGDWMPTSHCPSPHYINGHSHTNCAWTEGWANFFPLVVKSDPVLEYRNHYSIDLEAPTWGSSNWDDGDDVEGRVAGALWDIFDSVDDGDDTISNGFMNIWFTINDQNDNKFSEYWSAFKADHSSIAQSAKAAIYQNTIDYNDAPNTPTGLKDLSTRETDHTPSVYWTATGDPDSEDTVTYYVYSKDDTINTWDEDFTTTGSSGTLNRWTWDDGERGYWKVRAFDGLEWSSYSSSDLFAMNDPPDTPTNPTNLGTKLTDHTPSVSWTASTGNNDYGTDDVVTYYVYSKDEDNNMWALDFTTTGTSGILDRWDWDDGEWGYWKVKACDPYECSGYTTPDYFAFNIPPTANAGPDQVVNEGDTVTFDGSGSYDPDGTIISYAWTFGDGNSGTGSAPTHIYGDNGVFIVVLTVTDDSSEIGTDVMAVTVVNVAPIPSLVPTTIDEGETATLFGHATDPGSDDLTFEWSWSYGAPCDTTTEYLNDPMYDPDPYPSPTVNPRDVTESRSCQYGDNGVFTVILTVTDDDGGSTTVTTTVTVDNVDPRIDPTIRAYVLVDVTLRATGEKWHDLDLTLFEDGTVTGSTSITRYPGDPDDQSSTVTGIEMDILACSSWARVEYTPMDDAINGQIWGGTPGWIILTFEDGRESWLNHTFNVRHSDTWIWTIPDFCPFINATGLPIYFEATASDIGSDDLTFTWNWDDSSPDTVTTYYNNGVSPDPYPSPDVNPITETDPVVHTYTSSGTYTITLKVTDDDSGEATKTVTLTV